ncbi:MAG: phospho-N-acetylmuramoyl-pentapeptide-transferase [Acidimicrobiales bacterium]|nr:phospho-N-acetylmuramoyl-pentapeptide-transferase [Acidimicrobiales bacterium]
MIQLLIAVTVSIAVSLATTRYLIAWLTSHRIGQPIHDDVPEGHTTKAGTPTMGGVAIVAGLLVGYAATNLYRGVYTRTGIIVVLAIAAAGLVGLVDDWIKVSRERNLGLTKRAKLAGLVLVAGGFIVSMLAFTGVSTELAFTRAGHLGVDLGEWGWALFALLLIMGSTNAVNFTDGLDGLVGGSATLGFAAMTVIGFWAFRNPELYEVSHALDLAIVAVAMLGACLGFLWWNASPAQIFMGDTGSLAIGAAFATLALATNTHLLLVFIGGLYVMEALSVIIQIASFRLTGRRVFRMAPIHHHFELRGWPETTVIVRFWILAGIATAVGLGLFYADFITNTDLPARVVPG